MALADPFLLPILVRLTTAAAVVVVASLASERGGPFWGGIVVSLPVSAGPAYVLLALQQDAAFVSASALMSLACHAVTALYLMAYARTARKHGTLVTVAASLALWFAAVALVRSIPWNALTAIAANAAAFGFCLRATRSVAVVPAAVRASARRWYDLPLRALAVGVLVATVVTFSGVLGPAVTGIAAVFPVAVTSLGLTVQPRIGGPATAATMAGALRAMPGMGLGFLVLHLAAPMWGSAWGLLTALAASLVWPLALVTLRLRRRATLA